MFKKESEFENALINLLFEKGWERDVLRYVSEKDLIRNWAQILFDNNREIDRLNNFPLTDGEMQQIIEQVIDLRTPVRLNSFINGKAVTIKRDHPDDVAHFGKEVSLKIYDRHEIAAGQSRYQIVQQPKFPTKGIVNDRRGDLMLLINGMPVIHIELKASGVSVTQAANQISNYARSGIFSGLYSLVQIFVAMEPNETLYFANPGPDGRFNEDFYFHWADFDNEPINNWKDIVSTLLSIPMAHQLIGFYTIPDDSDGVLKVMRSYQYYAAHAISDRVSKIKWSEPNQYGGYIWHTTGSGKTMTSFKSAQLIANSKDADKVIFLMDRIELGTQSLERYRNFADDNEIIQATENTDVLVAKLKSDDPANTLIVTSIQKMSRIKEENGLRTMDIKRMAKKRIVFIVDEAHRSTFGEMLITVKAVFPEAIFFGFTGTPIHEENQIKGHTTDSIFGNELHRYSIADGIRDKNVLGFDPYMVMTFKDREVRQQVAMSEAKAKSEVDAVTDPEKQKVYYHFMDSTKVPMAGFTTSSGKYERGIEDYLHKVQYQTTEHRRMVVEDIADDWLTRSRNGKFHALFATSSIPDAIAYYRILREAKPDLKVTALFDPSIDNDDGAKAEFKEAGLVEIITDYYKRYGQYFSFATHDKFKRDIAARLAHKEPYRLIEREPDQQIDILIVVDQMLTGFDSKWINTLYLDKILEYQHVIQAFSRTNRLFGHDKPHGTIRYYRKPHTMEQNIAAAVKLYSGDKAYGLFVERLEENLRNANLVYEEIKQIFESTSIPDFEKNPDDETCRRKFASLFKKLSDRLESARIQGFTWEKLIYTFSHGKGKPKTEIALLFDETAYLILAQRYKELFQKGEGDMSAPMVPFEIAGYLTEIDTAKIDTDYMNSRFVKYLKLVHQNPPPDKDVVDSALDDLHKTFATLTQEEQKYAEIFLRDIQRGEVHVDASKTLRDYITEYQTRAKDDQIHRVAELFGVDENKLRAMMSLNLTESNINEFGRFSNLSDGINIEKANAYFVREGGKQGSKGMILMQARDLLRQFILEGGFDVELTDVLYPEAPKYEV